MSGSLAAESLRGGAEAGVSGGVGVGRGLRGGVAREEPPVLVVGVGVVPVRMLGCCLEERYKKEDMRCSIVGRLPLAEGGVWRLRACATLLSGLLSVSAVRQYSYFFVPVKEVK
jgi:hypothetical protein